MQSPPAICTTVVINNMKTNKIVPLFVVTFLVVAAAVVVTHKQSPTVSLEKVLLFPDLKDSINDVNEILIQSNQGNLTFFNDGGEWKIREADNFPVLFSKIRQTAIAVSELQIVSDKTSNPALYSNLGVEDPASADATSKLLTLRGSSGNDIITLIVGKNRLSSSPSDSPGLYVRLPSQTTALLVEGRLNVDTQVSDWIERTLVDIKPERVSHIDIIHGDNQDVTLVRPDEGSDLVLENVPAGKQAKSDYMMTRMQGILEEITIDNVRAGTSITLPDDSVKTTVITKDGLVAHITGAELDENNYAEFSFQYSAPKGAAPTDTDEGSDTGTGEESDKTMEVEQEVADLNARTSGWVFQIPTYKFDTIVRKLDDLVEDIPEPEETAED